MYNLMAGLATLLACGCSIYVIVDLFGVSGSSISDCSKPEPMSDHIMTGNDYTA